MPSYTHYLEDASRTIDLSANRQDEEPHRLDRLHHVIGYVTAFSEMVGADVLLRVASLHDHKGELTVAWVGDASDIDRQAFRRAWGTFDGGDAVRHVGHGG